TPALDMTANHTANEGDLIRDGVVGAPFTLYADILNVAADTRKIRSNGQVHTPVGVTRMVARVVRERRSDGRGESRSFRLLYRLRRSNLINIENLVVRQRIAGRHPEVLGEWEAQAQAAAGLAALEGRLARLVDLLVEEIEAGREVAIEEARLGKAEVDLEALQRPAKPETQELAIAQQVALGDAHISDHALVRRVAGAEGQFTGGLLLNLDIDDHPVMCRSGAPLDVHPLEEAERLQPLLGLLHQQRIIGVTF